MNPFLPKLGGVAPCGKARCPLEKPEDVNASLGVVDGAAHDNIEGEGTDLDLDSDGSTANNGKDIGADRAERTFESEVGNRGLLLEGLEDCELAPTVKVAFARGEGAGKGIAVGEVVYLGSAGFEDYLLATIGTEERTVSWGCEVGFDKLAVGFAEGEKHGDGDILAWLVAQRH